MKEQWNTNVSLLMHTFKSGLEALLPHLKRARIPLGVTAGTDSWDEISECLFQQIVLANLAWALPLEEMERLSVPKYEFTYESFGSFTGFVEVDADRTLPEVSHLVFYRFRIPQAAPYVITELEAIPINGKNESMGETLTMSTEGAEFSFVYRRPDRSMETLRDLNVVL